MIYFIQAEVGGPIKIGQTINLERRLFELQEGNPYKLVVLGVTEGNQSAEKRLHKKFEKHRYRSEWFEDCKEIRDFIENLHEFDYRLLLQEKKETKPGAVRKFDYGECLREIERTIQQNGWSQDEAKQKGVAIMISELREFGHTELRAYKLAVYYEDLFGRMGYAAEHYKQISLPIDSA